MKNLTMTERLYGTMHTDLAPQPYCPDFEFGASDKSLLDQMDQFVMREHMVLRAERACAYMQTFLNGPAEEIDKLVVTLGQAGIVSGVDQRDSDCLSVAVAAAAVIMAGKAERQTPRETLEGAVGILVARYLTQIP